jgi:hypothetical protein
VLSVLKLSPSAGEPGCSVRPLSVWREWGQWREGGRGGGGTGWATEKERVDAQEERRRTKKRHSDVPAPLQHAAQPQWAVMGEANTGGGGGGLETRGDEAGAM